MTDPLRPTAAVVYLIDAHKEQPTAGSRVLALNRGGVLVPTVWCSTSLQYFDAWMKSPKVPSSVKDRQTERYSNDRIA